MNPLLVAIVFVTLLSMITDKEGRAVLRDAVSVIRRMADYFTFATLVVGAYGYYKATGWLDSIHWL